jgi:hypothetical protein
MHSHHNPEDDSDIPEIKLPDGGFKAELPDSLLHECSEKDRYLYESLGQMKEYIRWSAPIMVDLNKQVRRTNGRVTKSEDDIDQLTEKIKSWIKFKDNVLNIVKSKYFIIGAAILVFLCLFPVVSFINTSGGLVKFIEGVIKFFIG